MNTMESSYFDLNNEYHIPALFGDDFTHGKSNESFLYMDKMILMMDKYGEERYGFQIKMKYSTADEYLATVEGCPKSICESEKIAHHWTGYYSTKPAMKQLIRDTYKNYRALSKFISFIKMVEVQSQNALIKQNNVFTELETQR